MMLMIAYFILAVISELNFVNFSLYWASTELNELVTAS